MMKDGVKTDGSPVRKVVKEEEPVESSDESEEESESVARSSELDPNDSIARALLKLAKKPTLNSHFREPDKLTFRATGCTEPPAVVDQHKRRSSERVL